MWHHHYTELIILFLSYSTGELGHYLLAVTSRSIAQDVEFGDQGCMALNASLEEEYQTSCVEYDDEILCEISSNISSYCKWDYIGRGLEYQILAGPAYVVIFTIMAVVYGILGDRYNRMRMLAITAALFSVMTFMTSFAKEYWQLLVLRFGFGATESACTPLASSVIAGKFTAKSRARAFGIFNWGIYLGYGLSFAMGNALTDANLFGKSWRSSYFLTGIIGIAIAIWLGIVGREQPHRNEIPDQDNTKQQQTISNRFSTVLKTSCCSVTIILLLTGACFRHSASFCWSYSAQNYFDTYYPGTNVGLFMFITSIIGGSVGIMVGAVASDIFVRKYGSSKRLWVLAISQAIASPFAAGVLLLAPPLAFVSLLFAYFFAEMWYGVFLTIITEFYPVHTRATAVGAVIFLINNIGGNSQLLVPPVSDLMGYREALLLLYPGFYFASSVFFFLAELTIIFGDDSHDKEAKDTIITTKL